MILDEVEVGDYDDEIMEEACIGHDYNIHSKGTPKSNDSPYTVKKSAKNTTTTSPSTSN
jgi:hypothetical protein